MNEHTGMKPHRHYYTSVVQVKNNFEPIPGQTVDGSQVYSLIEYAYMACNCGEVKKSRVRSEDNEQA